MNNNNVTVLEKPEETTTNITNWIPLTDKKPKPYVTVYITNGVYVVLGVRRAGGLRFFPIGIPGRGYIDSNDESQFDTGLAVPTHWIPAEALPALPRV